jgi:hypothetical protein
MVGALVRAMTRDEAATPRCARTVLAAALRKRVVNLLNGSPGQIAKGCACRFDPVGVSSIKIQMGSFKQALRCDPAPTCPRQVRPPPFGCLQAF